MKSIKKIIYYNNGSGFKINLHMFNTYIFDHDKTQWCSLKVRDFFYECDELCTSKLIKLLKEDILYNYAKN